MSSFVLESKKVKLVARGNPDHTWSGFVRYAKCKDYISPYLDRSGVLVTGLTDKEEREFEKLLGLEEFKLSKRSSFWDDYAVIMYDKPKEFDLSIPEDALAYKMLFGHKNVANSWSNILEWPFATYVITDDVLDAASENTSHDIKIKAVTLFGKMSADQMSSLLKLYSGNINNDNVPIEVVKSKLFKVMEDDCLKFIELVEDKALETKLMISQLVALKVLRKNRQAYYYGEDVLGHDLEETVLHIDNPENQGLKVALKQEVSKVNKAKK